MAERGKKKAPEETEWTRYRRLKAELEAQRANRQREMMRSFHQQFNLAIGTVGAIMFAGLVLVIQDPSPFIKQLFLFISPHDNFVLLVLMLSFSIVLAMLSVVASIFAGAEIVMATSTLGRYGYALGLLSIVGLVLSLTLMVADITPRGATVLAGGILFVFLIFALLARRSQEEKFTEDAFTEVEIEEPLHEEEEDVSKEDDKSKKE
jgi:hypothetical protein